MATDGWSSVGTIHSTIIPQSLIGTPLREYRRDSIVCIYLTTKGSRGLGRDSRCLEVRVLFAFLRLGVEFVEFGTEVLEFPHGVADHVAEVEGDPFGVGGEVRL